MSHVAMPFFLCPERSFIHKNPSLHTCKLGFF